MRWAWWTALIAAMLLIGQVPARAADVGAAPPGGPKAPVSRIAPSEQAPDAGACEATAPKDPPLWEQSLPIDHVSSDMKFTDPGCVSQVTRSADAVRWLNPDGTMTAAIFGAPVNYQAADGSWQPIDTRLDAAPDGGYVNRAGPLAVHFAGRTSAADLVRLGSGATSLAFGLAGVTSDQGVESPANVAAVVSGEGRNTLTYPSVWPNVDLRYDMLNVGTKEQIVLKAPLADGLRPSFEFNVALNGLTARTADDGAIEFVDAKGAVVSSIPRGLAVDAAEENTPATVTLMKTDDPTAATITVSVDSQWLSDPARVFPVSIDPSVTSTTGDDTMIGDGASAATNYYLYLSSTYFEWATHAGKVGAINYSALEHFNFSGLTGAYIVGATWNGYALGTGPTTPVPLTMKPISQPWASTLVTWNTKPNERTNTITTGGYTAGNQWKTANVTSWVQNYANGTWPNYGFELHGTATTRATLGSFASAHPANVQVTYDAYPSVSRPSAGGILTSSIVRTPTPTLSAQIDDADTPNGLVGVYAIYDSSLHFVQSGIGSSVNSSGRSSWHVPSALTPGNYYYVAYPNDGYTYGTPTGYTTLTVDTAGPTTPSIGIDEVSANAWNPAGGDATLHFAATSPVDINGFYWGIDVGNNPTALAVATSNSATITTTPSWGWHDLAVRAIDKAGTVSSSVAHYAFGWGTGGLNAPTEFSTTDGDVVVAATAPVTVDGLTLQWRRSDSDSWRTVPAADITNAGTPIGAWPVTTTPGIDRSSFPTLTWDASATTAAVDGNVGGPIQLQAGFSSGVGSASYSSDGDSIVNLAVNPSPLGENSVSEAVGPGAVDLLSGNFELTGTDASTPAGGVSRVFQSLEPAHTGGVFGPGWSSSLDAALPTGRLIHNRTTGTGTFVTITGVDSSKLDFQENADGSYTPPAGSTLVLTYDAVADQYDLHDLESRTTTAFTSPYATDEYVLTSVQHDGASASDVSTWDLTHQRLASQTTGRPGVTCTVVNWNTTPGCQTLSFDYASTTTATGNDPGQWGDYAGQLRAVYYTAWDSDLGAMNTVNVATYQYDSNGMLRAAWDPRISPALKTTYNYDAYGHVSALTPPGLNSWTFNYAPRSGSSEPASIGRLASVSRPGIPTGTATETVVYDVPISGTTSSYPAPDMSFAEVSKWAQTDVPTSATAIYPPDQTPSGPSPTDFKRATIYYLDSQGQLVNVAEPGGYISTTEYDQYGNPVRELTAANRQEAIASSSSDLQRAAMARILDTETVYSDDGSVVTDTFGPAHVVDLADTSSSGPARRHQHLEYDENVPSTPVDLTSEVPFDLVTTVTDGAAPLDGGSDEDVRTTTNAYDDGGTDESGWTFGAPLRTIVDSGGLELTTTTRYDSEGNVVAKILPANPSGGDAHETRFTYYSASGTGTCNGAPEYAGALCTRGLAAQPTTGSTVPNSQVTKYNLYDEPEITVNTSGSDTRTTTAGYDTAGRPVSLAVGATGTGTGATTPPVTTTYDDAKTGFVAETSMTSPAQTISRTYDDLGRLETYKDADSTTANAAYDYDMLDRVTSITDGKGTTQYRYDDVGGERRGLLTTISDSAVGDFTATYTADGNLAAQTYPGSLSASYTYDETGQPVSLDYAKGTGYWPDSYRQYNIHGEATSMTSGISTYHYSYDGAGRLIDTYQDSVFGCIDRAYTFDDDTNRTSLVTNTGVTWASSPANCPPPGSGTTTSYSYDQADRLTGTGYNYDSLGRTTAMPGSTSPTGFATTLGYYTNDIVRTTTVGGGTTTYNIDPMLRADSFNAGGQTHTSHFAGDSDAPAWTTENTAGSDWTRFVSAFNGTAARVIKAGSSTTIALNLVNLHGDVIAPAATSDSTWNLSAMQTETSEYGVTSFGSADRYDYLGTQQRQRDVTSGLQLMGLRLYNPTTGRFLQRDPVLGGSANAYDYADADPVNGVDLSGEDRHDLYDVAVKIYRTYLAFGQGLGAELYFGELYLSPSYRVPHYYIYIDGFGRRFIDWAYPATKDGWEIKASKYVSLAGLARQQVVKDATLVAKYHWWIEWDIFPNYAGQVGVSKPLVNYLDAAGINVIVHHFYQSPNPTCPRPSAAPFASMAC